MKWFLGLCVRAIEQRGVTYFVITTALSMLCGVVGGVYVAYLLTH